MAISVSFPFSWAAQPRAWGLGPSLSGCWFSLPRLISHSSNPQLLNRGMGPTLLGAGFLYRILTPIGLVYKLTDFLSSPSYIIVPPPPSCGRHNLAVIQPVHGQGYNILIIPRPDAPVIYTGAFPILTARLGRRSIYNNTNAMLIRNVTFHITRIVKLLVWLIYISTTSGHRSVELYQHNFLSTAGFFV